MFALKQVEMGEGWCLKEEEMIKQVTLPRMSRPPASLACTVHSHCMDSVLDFCSFFRFCIPLSGHQYTLVYKAHSDKTPARGKHEMMSQGLRAVSNGIVIILFLYVSHDARIK